LVHRVFARISGQDFARWRSSEDGVFAPFARAAELSALTCLLLEKGWCAMTAVLGDLASAAELEGFDCSLVVRRLDPFNAETPMSALNAADVTPVAKFYARNHFPIPAIDVAQWQLTLTGCVRRRFALSLSDLRGMSARTEVVTLECAGNNRVALNPVVPGEQWQLGAVSTAAWTGVPLIELLSLAHPTSRAREVVFRGADHGHVDGVSGTVFFERSLSLADVEDSGALLAYEMNGVPLRARNGYPLRLIVPGWYGVASVKWLTEIRVLDQALRSFYQTERYYIGTEPLRRQRVRAVITSPASDQTVARGEVTIRGLAWSGSAAISLVEVSVSGGPWRRARLVGREERYGWRRWELRVFVEGHGAVSFRARATDLAGNTQPFEPEWNPLGYGANSVQTVVVHVEE
jgi:DMSO/TMAO reductase YedYZ molybdopterin-dependent catalytic subunit